MKAFCAFISNCGGIQLISAIKSFHIGPFPTVIHGGMVRRKKALSKNLRPSEELVAVQVLLPCRRSCNISLSFVVEVSKASPRVCQILLGKILCFTNFLHDMQGKKIVHL
jgi:hypothetical protein